MMRFDEKMMKYENNDNMMKNDKEMIMLKSANTFQTLTK